MQNTQLVPFTFGKNRVRTLTDANGVFWFIAKDVCQVLEIEKYRDAISRLDEDERESVIVDTLGGAQKMTIISESGLYSLIFRSRKPEARGFSKWVRSEVLPTLRKTGRYAMPDMKSQLRTDVEHGGDILFSRAVTQHDTQTRVLLMEQAVQMAQKTAMNIHEMEEYFVRLCRMAGLPRKDEDKSRRIRRFIDEQMTSLPGRSLPFMRIYSAFYEWWETNEHGPVPGSKSLALALREYFEPQKSNTSHFRDCALRA